jgi:hypothetical protein
MRFGRGYSTRKKRRKAKQGAGIRIVEDHFTTSTGEQHDGSQRREQGKRLPGPHRRHVRAQEVVLSLFFGGLLAGFFNGLMLWAAGRLMTYDDHQPVYE